MARYSTSHLANAAAAKQLAQAEATETYYQTDAGYQSFLSLHASEIARIDVLRDLKARLPNNFDDLFFNAECEDNLCKTFAADLNCNAADVAAVYEDLDDLIAEVDAADPAKR